MKRLLCVVLASVALLCLASCGQGGSPADGTDLPEIDTGGMTLEKINDLVIYDREGDFNAFPSIARAADGSYLLAFRHAPDRRAEYDGLITHNDPDSMTCVMKSTDGCQTWGEPRTLPRLPGCGAQDPVLNVLDDGTVLLTVFFWRYFDVSQKAMLERVIRGRGGLNDVMGLTAYCAGAYTYLSRDNGGTWDGPHLISEDYVIRGRCAQLSDGLVLAPLYGEAGIALFASHDQGLTWEPYAYVTGPLGKSQTAHEPALFRTRSGRLFCFIRTDDGMYYCVSGDDGRTFGEPIETGLPGSVPYDALQLPSGNVYLTYGHRKEPFGIRALLLDGECNGISAEREIVLRDDGLGTDISYTSSAVLPDGGLLTVYYYYTDENDQRRCIAGTVLRETAQ